jgi:hypothetical protein
MGSKCCRVVVLRVVFVVTLLVCIAVAGGILIWQYLPDNQKNAISGVAEGIQITNGEEVTAPPSNYTFEQCGSTISTSSSNSSDCCNGLRGLCDLAPDDILFAGIHNAQSSSEDGYYVVPNHQYNVISALDYGYRTLNFDIGICNDQMLFVHGSCKLPTSDPVKTFTAINQWLDEHPTEVIIIPFEIVNDLEKPVSLDELYNLLNTIDGFTDKMYQKVIAEPWPDLRTMIASNKRVLVFQYGATPSCSAGFYNSNNNETTNVYVCPPGFHDWFTFAGESKFDFNEETEFMDKEVACNITRGRPAGPFFALNVFLVIPSKKVQSEVLNTKSFLQDHIAMCSFENGGLDVNVVFVDFWSVGNLPEVVQLHNKALISRRQRQLGQKRLLQ